MKYLGVLMLCISLLALKIYSKDKEEGAKHVETLIVQNMQDDDISDIRDDLLEKFNDIKTELALVRTQMQTEMRKDTPDWEKIRQMNNEQFRLQNMLAEKMSEYKESVKTLQGENKLGKK
ncbi:hypothetical protein IX317_000457 [Fusobacterium sp. DD29]|uniref:hypothetical protein n=1 Tax=unclassified Fusobacterium TaxID=2648384 RepID=UPI001B8BD526|nr:MULTISPECIES: hypothetical protein [unclassified Fusobacterium]MBR8700207.1 hypothetical protein [Fusobacterium sp. DD45]MBR8710342.1 hypothetical protein [Fusobacterium sp. DD28]MBR8748796.1 hypothetical protein [Fusobacterium sp. DD29]MBR8750929.1 hypothetical protein [Fusobacterium sp. DD26]MBR8761047.1 hypothetical protein [Fusobacterium sp. DD25]